jgi:hypothetical protein
MLLGESAITDSNCHPERSPNPPGEDESTCPGVPWRDPENPANTHALVMHFHQKVSNLPVMPGMQPKNTKSARAITAITRFPTKPRLNISQRP